VVATWDDVRRLALALPQTAERPEGEHTQWRVKDKLFVWMRPLRKADYAELGDSAPSGPILSARTPGLEAKEALLSEGGPYFTTPHFNGYPAILVQLDVIGLPDLEELITEAWATQAPKRVAAEYFKNST
jgi:hypothetical protein